MPFKPGHSGTPQGKPKGALNGTTLALKEAIIRAAEHAGNVIHHGGHAHNEGLVGYLEHLALTNQQAFTPLLGKVLPMQVTGEGGGPVVIVTGVQRAEDKD
jgi:hypothetical protein